MWRTYAEHPRACGDAYLRLTWLRSRDLRLACTWLTTDFEATWGSSWEGEQALQHGAESACHCGLRDLRLRLALVPCRPQYLGNPFFKLLEERARMCTICTCRLARKTAGLQVIAVGPPRRTFHNARNHAVSGLGTARG